MSRISRASISTCLRALVKHKEAQYNRGFIRRSVPMIGLSAIERTSARYKLLSE